MRFRGKRSFTLLISSGFEVILAGTLIRILASLCIPAIWFSPRYSHREMALRFADVPGFAVAKGKDWQEFCQTTYSGLAIDSARNQ